jgi:arsenical pump membrane protein
VVDEAVAVALLAIVLGGTVVRPRGIPEWAVAVPAALLALAAGGVSWPHARAELSSLGPVVGFLAAVLALAAGCADEGLFAALGARLAGRARGGPVRLLGAVFVLASLTTAVLSLDTTVVLLTPVVVAMATRAGVSVRPSAYACATLANASSLLLPVANLTNLLALAVLPITFVRFAGLMLLPWLVVIGLTWLGYRVVFRADLVGAPRPDDGVIPRVPTYAAAIVLLTLVGFVVSSLGGAAPVWAAVAGAVALAVPRLLRRRVGVVGVLRSAAPGFCLFVLALGVVVRAVSDHGLGSWLPHVVPRGSSYVDLLAVAAVGAVAANVVNNLPATLLLLPVTVASGPAAVLALLIGVNVGPNLTYPGSLATLLWRRVVAGVSDVPRAGEFTWLGVLTVPPSLVAGCAALWLSLRVIGT